MSFLRKDNDWQLLVSQGNTAGVRYVHKFGANSGINSNIETVWAHGGLHYNPTSAGTLEVVSDSAEDVGSGDGLATLVIQGLDANFNEIEETINLNGLTPVTTIQSFMRVHRAYGTLLGVGATIADNPQFSNLGTITVTSNTMIAPNNVLAAIPPTLGQTQLGLYTVPAGHSAHIYSFSASSGKEVSGAGANPVTSVHFLQRPADGAPQAWRLLDEFVIKDTAIQITYPFPVCIPEKTDIEVRAFTTSDVVPVSAEFDLLLVRT
jgi:hypothetical protein